MDLAQCCGIIVIDPNTQKTILVTTPNGNHSFPKGGRHRYETELQCGYRELQEETGLTMSDVELLLSGVEGNPMDNLITLDELSRKNKLSVRYYVGYLDKQTPHTFTYNKILFYKEELSKVGWYTLRECIQFVEDGTLKPNRLYLLEKAYNLMFAHK